MTESRKRIRSDEDDYGLQTKFFVNQQMVEKSDKQLMQKVYGKSFDGIWIMFFKIDFLSEKTLKMIFAGAKRQNQNVQNIANNNIALVEIENNEKELAMMFDSIDDVKSCSYSPIFCLNSYQIHFRNQRMLLDVCCAGKISNLL